MNTIPKHILVESEEQLIELFGAIGIQHVSNTADGYTRTAPLEVVLVDMQDIDADANTSYDVGDVTNPLYYQNTKVP